MQALVAVESAYMMSFDAEDQPWFADPIVLQLKGVEVVITLSLVRLSS